jgi:hypothetical protein
VFKGGLGSLRLHFGWVGRPGLWVFGPFGLIVCLLKVPRCNASRTVLGFVSALR